MISQCHLGEKDLMFQNAVHLCDTVKLRQRLHSANYQYNM